MDANAAVAEFTSRINAIKEQMARVIVGQEQIVEGVLMCLCAGGHVLLEGVPGLGKTLMVRTLAGSLGLDFSRIQFTPDLMPADVTGTNIIAELPDGRKEFQFQRGAVFTNVLLADEINRATPKTQSALLEAMQERSVTVAGKTYNLEEPYIVLATQNPIEMEGTYPLPEAQLDRFLFKLMVPSPPLAELATTVGPPRGPDPPPPSEMEGTYPLPEAQLDRFLFKLMVPSPTLAELATIVDRTTGAQTPTVEKMLGAREILR